MNCPVCENDLSLPDTLKETMELHYDCPSCFSSLFLKGGKCEVLSQRTVSEKLPDGETKSAGPSPAGPDSDGDTEREEAAGPRDRAAETVSEADTPISPAVKPPESGEPVEEALPETPEIPSLKTEEETEPEALDVSSGGEKGVPPPPPAMDSDSLSEEANLPSASSPAEAPESFEFAEESVAAKSGDEDVSISATQASAAESALSREKQDPPMEQDQEEDFSGVEKFGNSPAPAGKGAFYYNVTVEEIDSEDLRAETEEILGDPALKLAPEQRDMSIQDGRLTVSKISPVQAHVIVKSLLGLSLKISWEQHLVADASPPPAGAP